MHTFRSHRGSLLTCNHLAASDSRLSPERMRQLYSRPAAPRVRRWKSAIDIGLALLFSPVALLAGAAVALLIRLTSSGPVFYRHRRIGLGGEPFFMMKFRTMHEDSEELLQHYLEGDPIRRLEWEENHKLRHDPRVTPLGAWLRRYSLDELPQLWNVLRGEMSLVGPRPIVVDEVHKYGRHFACYCSVRPGMSGLWQVSRRSTLTYAQRVALDCRYASHPSLWADFVILLRTFHAVVRPDGAS